MMTTKTKEETTDLVWLLISLAKKVKKLKNDKIIEDMILKYIEDSKKYLQ